MSRHTFLFTSSLLLFAGSATAAPMHLWSKSFTSSGVDVGLAVDTDVSRNVVTAGTFQFTVDFGGGPMTGFPSTFVLKSDPSGVHLWSRSWAASCTDMTLDASGNVVVVGSAAGTVDFGGGPVPGPDRLYVVKYDANGGYQWVRRFANCVAHAVAADAAGNVIVTGELNGTTDFGGGPLTGAIDVFVVKLDAAGNHVWSRAVGSSIAEDFGDDVAVDGAGNIIVAGVFGDTVDFGGGLLTTAGDTDFFVVKYDATGAHQWSRRAGNEFRNLGIAVGADALGNVVVTGGFGGTINFGGSDLVATGGDVFLAKYDAAGVHQWSARYGGTSGDRGLDVDVDPAGNIAVSGRFRGTASFGGGSFASAGGDDIFVARYDASGAHEWSRAFGSNATDIGGNQIPEGGNAVCIDAAGNTIATGACAGTVDFGGGPLVGTGREDVFVAKYGEMPLPVLISDFSARARDNAVHVAWDFSSDEALDAFTLYRTSEGDARAIVVATGDARTRSVTDKSVAAGKRYEYELTISTMGGDVFRSPVASVEMPALANSLEQNRPNPFNPSTTIAYTLGERASTAVAIYDAKGALVVRLDQGDHDAGTRRVTWDGRDASGRAVASGVYFYQLEGVTGLGSRKMVLIK